MSRYFVEEVYGKRLSGVNHVNHKLSTKAIIVAKEKKSMRGFRIGDIDRSVHKTWSLQHFFYAKYCLIYFFFNILFE